MKLIYLSGLIIILSISNLFSQEKLESDIDLAFQNAKKGIYWALSNIPDKKSSIDNDLIAEDKLYASVKLSKEINGVKVSSKGFYNTNEVEITVYKSYEGLKRDGYTVPNEANEK